ncbi:hypothetical protein [Furfurilactobacillus milii]|uniref:DUF2929 family protein n=1 Tax=Furfurilactobacillus rossiae TaxID=231049 RepID=A0A7C9IRV5_9LACO|nr:hypothetical protein [Furfurilactobacillus milii]MYV04814.1 hypothetical protein [Furfurilactobacillus milii]
MQRDDSLIVWISGSVLPLIILIGLLYGLIAGQVITGLVVGIIAGLLLAGVSFISFAMLEDVFAPKA